MILRRTSALEHLQLFSGYVNGKNIEVYSRSHGGFENINYYLVDSFDSIDYIRIGNVMCRSVSQTINDLLSDLDSIDEQPLVEGLSRYYYTNGKSFNGIQIRPENMTRFNSIKDWAIEYYDEV